MDVSVRFWILCHIIREAHRQKKGGTDRSSYLPQQNFGPSNEEPITESIPLTNALYHPVTNNGITNHKQGKASFLIRLNSAPRASYLYLVLKFLGLWIGDKSIVHCVGSGITNHKEGKASLVVRFQTLTWCLLPLSRAEVNGSMNKETIDSTL